MDCPTEIAKDLAEKYFSIKAKAIAKEIAEPYFEKNPDEKMKLLEDSNFAQDIVTQINSVREDYGQEKSVLYGPSCAQYLQMFRPDIISTQQIRDETLNTLYQKISRLEEDLKNQNPEKVKSALDSLSSLNSEIMHNTECPGKALSDGDYTASRKHKWFSPYCFDSGYKADGEHLDYFSRYEVCLDCRNFIIDL